MRREETSAKYGIVPVENYARLGDFWSLRGRKPNLVVGQSREKLSADLVVSLREASDVGSCSRPAQLG